MTLEHLSADPRAQKLLELWPIPDTIGGDKAAIVLGTLGFDGADARIQTLASVITGAIFSLSHRPTWKPVDGDADGRALPFATSQTALPDIFVRREDILWQWCSAYVGGADPSPPFEDIEACESTLMQLLNQHHRGSGTVLTSRAARLKRYLAAGYTLEENDDGVRVVNREAFRKSEITLLGSKRCDPKTIQSDINKAWKEAHEATREGGTEKTDTKSSSPWNGLVKKV